MSARSDYIVHVPNNNNIQKGDCVVCFSVFIKKFPTAENHVFDYRYMFTC